MPGSLNRVQLMGHLGRDADSKELESGQVVLTLSIATTWRKKVGDEWKDETDWHRVQCWGCENVKKFLTKGTKIMVEGRLKHRSWEKDGETRYATEVVVGNAGGIFLLGKRDGGNGAVETEKPTSTKTAEAVRKVDPNDPPF